METAITFEGRAVEKVYVGKAGCMCGCGGRYHYASGPDATKRSPAIAQREIERAAAIIANPGDLEVERDGGYVYVETQPEDDRKPARCICIYFAETAS